MFVKLTAKAVGAFKGGEFYISVDAIKAVSPVDTGTGTVVELGNDYYHVVTETVEEVLGAIRLAKVGSNVP